MAHDLRDALADTIKNAYQAAIDARPIRNPWIDCADATTSLLTAATSPSVDTIAQALFEHDTDSSNWPGGWQSLHPEERAIWMEPAQRAVEALLARAAAAEAAAQR